jgi:hypothetical protein
MKNRWELAREDALRRFLPGSAPLNVTEKIIALFFFWKWAFEFRVLHSTT